jgi:hypothetical protein
MEKLGGDPFFFRATDKYYSSDYFCQAFWVVQFNSSFLCSDIG